MSLYETKKNFFLVFFQKIFLKYQFLVTFLATVILNVDYGLGIGVIYYILMHMIRSIEPYSTRLGNIPGTELYKDVNIYKQVIITFF